MPTYEYRCTECDQTFEAVQAFTDDSIEVCPSCGGRVRKLFGNVGIVFKGSGFYKTDSRDKKSAVSTADSGGSGTPSSESTSTNGSGGDKPSTGDNASNGKSDPPSKSKSESTSSTPADKTKATASSTKSDS